MIEVFIRSNSQYIDLGHYREMAVHPFCSPEMATVLENELTAMLKDRILPQGDLTVLQKMSEIAKTAKEEIKVYDISRITDRMRAIKKGVQKTPTVIINGEKHEGLERSIAILSKYNM